MLDQKVHGMSDQMINSFKNYIIYSLWWTNTWRTNLQKKIKL